MDRWHQQSSSTERRLTWPRVGVVTQWLERRSLARVPFESLRERFGTHSLPTFVILNHSLLFVGISKHAIFS